MKKDEELLEFGIKRENEERRDGGCGLVFDPETEKYAVAESENDELLRLFAGGVDADEDIKEGVLREVREESGLHEFSHVEKVVEIMAHYRHSLKNVNRVTRSTTFLVILKNKNLIPQKLEEHEKFTLKFVTEEELLSNWEKAKTKHDIEHYFHILEKGIKKLKELGYAKV